MTLDILKQSAIQWSYIYKPKNSNVRYHVVNTCPIDTSLQMIYFLWLRQFVPHSIVEKDSLLLKALNNVRKRDYNKARHEVIVERSLPHRVDVCGNVENWNCEGDFMDYKAFPSLFKSNGPIYMTWGDCSKMGENCPFHNYFQYQSRRSMTVKSKPKLHFMPDPRKKETFQERIYLDFEVNLCSCKKRSPIKVANNEAEDGVPVLNEFCYCPENGMRQAHTTASFSSCPWVMTFCGEFPNYSTLNEIPKAVLMPPKTHYFLASIILYDGGHFIGLSLDVKILKEFT